MGKVNCFVGINRDCVSASKETLCLYVRVWMCTWCARVGKRCELARLMVGGGCVEGCVFKSAGS